MQHIKTAEKPQEFLVFKIQLLRKYVKQHHPKRPTTGNSVVSKEEGISRETKKEARKPLFYVIETDQEILVWLLEMMDLHLRISSLALRKIAKSKIQPYCQEFKACRGWLQKFSQLHGLALQRCMSITQKLPKQLDEKLSAFQDMCIKFLKIAKYPLALVSSMDETPVFFDMANKSFAKRGSESVTVRSSGCEKNHVTVVLTIAACGDIFTTND